MRECFPMNVRIPAIHADVFIDLRRRWTTCCQRSSERVISKATVSLRFDATAGLTSQTRMLCRRQ
jgi:hypothetical protein